MRTSAWYRSAPVLGWRASATGTIPGVPFVGLPAHMEVFDIGLAVIADIRFNRTRSNVKLKEYAALGIPWLAFRR